MSAVRDSFANGMGGGDRFSADRSERRECGEPGMLWTEEAIETLKALALEGRSAAGIAEALGAASRNAVIGKANRMGVRLNGDGRASAPASRARRPASLFSRGARTASFGRTRTAWAYEGAEVGEMRRVRFDDIVQTACRWPLGDPRCGDFAYCGLAPVNGRSYCAGHCRLAYRRG